MGKIYLINAMKVLEIIRFAHVNALIKAIPFCYSTCSHFNTHLRWIWVVGKASP